MGTPASIASDLPQHQTPKSCTRKRASANIFHGVGLWQLRRLFHSTGDAQAEERAQLVWECAENRCITQALQKLHRRQRKLRLQSHLRPPSNKSSSARLLELQHFSRLRIEDCTTSGTDADSSSSRNTESPDQTGHSTGLHYRKKGGMGAAGYLHQLHR
ncbi:arginine vasopressin-induced protein 1 [Pogona vitticeps]|uniref:Arginine vasopressin-induced protein 1 n=1 Tax=Pogona vitticeps TaxID=103695 RepID=A0A6J0V881_9SAUR